MDHAPTRFALILAMAALQAACTTTARLREAEVARGQEIAITASGLVGTPYQFGGTHLEGFDCSGLAVYAYEKVGIAIPRTAAEQRRSARPVLLRNLQPGDLVFFRIRARHVDHVGVYVGDGRFVHAPRSGALVTYATLTRGFYRRHLVSAGRFW